MPPLRARMNKTRPATDSPNARMNPSLSLVKSMKPMLDTITVTAITATAPAPAPASSSSLVQHVIETSDLMMTDVRNQAAIAEALTKANHMLQSNRAENTKKAYTPKKKLWTMWCQTRGFIDGDTVTEGKLCLWLQEEVFVNGSQAQGDRKGSMLSPQGVEGYIKPIIALYEVSICFLFITENDLLILRLKGP